MKATGKKRGESLRGLPPAGASVERAIPLPPTPTKQYQRRTELHSNGKYRAARIMLSRSSAAGNLAEETIILYARCFLAAPHLSGINKNSRGKRVAAVAPSHDLQRLSPYLLVGRWVPARSAPHRCHRCPMCQLPCGVGSRRKSRRIILCTLWVGSLPCSLPGGGSAISRPFTKYG